MSTKHEVDCSVWPHLPLLTVDEATARPCSVLGLGLLPALQYAGARLLAPGARVVPACVQVCNVGPFVHCNNDIGPPKFCVSARVSCMSGPGLHKNACKECQA